MISSEKPDIVYLLAGKDTTGLEYLRYNVRIVNIQNATVLDKTPQNSISQIGTAKFDALEILNICFSIENEETIIMVLIKKVDLRKALCLSLTQKHYL
ncbi:MAG: hypothetical protein EZS28_033219 [Streblomastix strix]|uniref:Uncharacterized protein n=1 Tax=Streblomastix strix TaxID=222440 RepID=A0A5J4UM00_9EUKA|nr:MAG: hypothetical protein EZS28_033219 [Streblomastix strix]